MCFHVELKSIGIVTLSFSIVLRNSSPISNTCAIDHGCKIDAVKISARNGKHGKHVGGKTERTVGN